MRCIDFDQVIFICRLSQCSTTTTLLHRITIPSHHPSPFSIKTTSKVKASVISREDDLLLSSYTNGSLINEDSSAPPPPNGFVAEDDDYELDLPTPGFSSIPEAIEDIRQGKVRSVSALLA